jgi:hypothetical protein
LTSQLFFIVAPPQPALPALWQHFVLAAGLHVALQPAAAAGLPPHAAEQELLQPLLPAGFAITAQPCGLSPSTSA